MERLEKDRYHKPQKRKRRDSFIENQQVAFSTASAASLGPVRRYVGRTTYEFLVPDADANVLVADELGTPVIVTQSRGNGLVAYFNMCAHNCLTPFPLKSPIRQSDDLARILLNFTLWVGAQR